MTTSLISRPLALRLVSVVAVAIGFYLPLAAVPMFADSAGTSSAAGMANGALLFATVASELATPRLIARIGYRSALALGLVLLGLPALVLLTPVGASVWAIVLVSAVRGIGFAISVVAGGALTAALIPAERRGEGLALVGLVGGIPALLSLPFGSWAAAHWGYGVVFVLTAVIPLAAIVTVPDCRHARLPRPAGAAHGRSAQRRPDGAGDNLRGVGVSPRGGRDVRPACGSQTTPPGSHQPRC